MVIRKWGVKLRDSVKEEEHQRSYFQEIIPFLNQYRKTTLYQKTNRNGYLEQVAELIGILVNRKEAEHADLVYSATKKDILKEEGEGSSRLCPCKENGIDLRRLSAEHYHTFSKNIRDYYDSLSNSSNYIVRKKDKNRFLVRLQKNEKKLLNLEWRKWEIELEKSEKPFADWGNKCLSNCISKEFVRKKKDNNGFKDLLPCAGLSTSPNNRDLTSIDYETLMNNWDEHFEKHLKYRTLHDPKSCAIHFLGLQRWNSTSPAQGKSLGGGYLIYHTNKDGCIDLGIAVDPGFDFIRNLFHVGFSLADIDIVILSHAHVDHVRDFESMLDLLFELKSRAKQQEQKLHTIMTLGVYHRLQYLIDSPGLREFVEPYIVDIEKGVDSKSLFETKIEFTQLKGKTRHGIQFTPLIKGVQSKINDKIKVIIKPTEAYHNDHSECSDTYGFKIRIDDNNGAKKYHYTIGYTSDTRWHNEVMKSYSDCNAILIHLGSLINRKKGEEGAFDKFEHYKNSKDCTKLIRKKNHPYLMGMLYFLKQIKGFKTNPLILLSEFGEELRGKIRLDLIKRLKIEYGNGTKRDENILPVDVGLDVVLFDQQPYDNCPSVWCIQCQKFVSLTQVDFETYGYDEALFCVCKTCGKSTPQNVLHESLRSLYEVRKTPADIIMINKPIMKQFNLAVKILSEFINIAVNKNLEIVRIAKAGCSLVSSGAFFSGNDKEEFLQYVISAQYRDGGWADPEETAWAANIVSQVKGCDDRSVLAAIQWLKANRLDGGGWGKHSRDRARIPSTALVLTLLPEAGSNDDYKWVAQEWAKDLSGSVQLSYKAGFYLLVAGHPSIQGDSVLIDRTIRHLIDDQNEDGGFAPWKNHPIGSDPWSTGVVLWGLSKWIDRVDPAVIERALHWLEVTQLPSGYWPYHYLDEGTSYALIGAVSAMRAMASRK